MKGRIGTKHYDTEKAELIEALPDGTQVYKKLGRSRDYFLYNPNGKTTREMFSDLPRNQTIKYMTPPDESYMKVLSSSGTIRFSRFDRDRIKYHANQLNMSMAQFIIMLVDKYEAENRDRSH